MKQFVPFDQFDQFDQYNKFPHKSSRQILADLEQMFQGILSIQAGIGITVDNTDIANPIVNAVPYVLPQATPIVLGGLRLGYGLAYNPTTQQVDVTVDEDGVANALGIAVVPMVDANGIIPGQTHTPSIDGQRIYVEHDDGTGDHQYGAMSPTYKKWKGIRILESHIKALTGTHGASSCNLVIGSITEDEVRSANLIWSGEWWAVRLIVNGVTIAAGISESVLKDDVHAIGVDAETGNVYFYNKGKPVLDGAFASGQEAEGFFDGFEEFVIVQNLAFQSEGMGDYRYVSFGPDMKHNYGPAVYDWGGNWIQGKDWPVVNWDLTPVELPSYNLVKDFEAYPAVNNGVQTDQYTVSVSDSTGAIKFAMSQFGPDQLPHSGKYWLAFQLHEPTGNVSSANALLIYGRTGSEYELIHFYGAGGLCNKLGSSIDSAFTYEDTAILMITASGSTATVALRTPNGDYDLGSVTIDEIAITLTQTIERTSVSATTSATVHASLDMLPEGLLPNEDFSPLVDPRTITPEVSSLPALLKVIVGGSYQNIDYHPTNAGTCPAALLLDKENDVVCPLPRDSVGQVAIEALLPETMDKRGLIQKLDVVEIDDPEEFIYSIENTELFDGIRISGDTKKMFFNFAGVNANTRINKVYGLHFLNDCEDVTIKVGGTDVVVRRIRAGDVVEFRKFTANTNSWDVHSNIITQPLSGMKVISVAGGVWPDKVYPDVIYEVKSNDFSAISEHNALLATWGGDFVDGMIIRPSADSGDVFLKVGVASVSAESYILMGCTDALRISKSVEGSFVGELIQYSSVAVVSSSAPDLAILAGNNGGAYGIGEASTAHPDAPGTGKGTLINHCRMNTLLGGVEWFNSIQIFTDASDGAIYIRSVKMGQAYPAPRTPWVMLAGIPSFTPDVVTVGTGGDYETGDDFANYLLTTTNLVVVATLVSNVSITSGNWVTKNPIILMIDGNGKEVTSPTHEIVIKAGRLSPSGIFNAASTVNTVTLFGMVTNSSYTFNMGGGKIFNAQYDWMEAGNVTATITGVDNCNIGGIPKNVNSLSVNTSGSINIENIRLKTVTADKLSATVGSCYCDQFVLASDPGANACIAAEVQSGYLGVGLVNLNGFTPDAIFQNSGNVYVASITGNYTDLGLVKNVIDATTGALLRAPSTVAQTNP